MAIRPLTAIVAAGALMLGSQSSQSLADNDKHLNDIALDCVDEHPPGNHPHGSADGYQRWNVIYGYEGPMLISDPDEIEVEDQKIVENDFCEYVEIRDLVRIEQMHKSYTTIGGGATAGVEISAAVEADAALLSGKVEEKVHCQVHASAENNWGDEEKVLREFEIGTRVKPCWSVKITYGYTEYQGNGRKTTADARVTCIRWEENSAGMLVPHDIAYTHCNGVDLSNDATGADAPHIFRIQRGEKLPGCIENCEEYWLSPDGTGRPGNPMGPDGDVIKYTTG